MNETHFKAHSVLSCHVWGAGLWVKCLSILAPWEESKHSGCLGTKQRAATAASIPAVVMPTKNLACFLQQEEV